MALSFNTTKKKAIQKKKLHVVWFVDTTKTNTFSIAQWILWALAGFVLLCIAIFAFSLSLATKQALQIKSQEKYIQELKANVIELYLKVSENESSAQDPAENELANPPAAQSANQPNPAATPHPEAKAQEPSFVAFEGFSIGTSPSGKGSTANIMLVNKKTDAPLSGFTCAVFYLKNGSTLAVPAQDLRAGDTCSKGVPVKFSKIRPTAFETDTETALIKSVEIQFHSRNSSRPEKNTFRIGN